MKQRMITKSTLRSLVKTLLEDKGLGPALVKVNPVVDPSAALTDPSNQDFKPTNRPELLASLSAIVSDIPDENIPGVYDKIRAMTNQEGPEMNNKKVEEIVRNQIKKIINEIFLGEARPPVPPGPKIPKPSNYLGPVELEFPDTTGMSKKQEDDKKKDFKGKIASMYPTAALTKYDKDNLMGNAIWKSKAQRYAAAETKKQLVPPNASGIPEVGEKYLKLSTAAQMTLNRLFADPVETSKKNLTTADVDGAVLLELAREFDFANPNGVLQWIKRILAKMRKRIENLEEVEIIKLATMNEYIAGLVKAGTITPEEGKLWRDNPEILDVIEDNKDFRIMFDTALKKAGM